MPFQTINTPPKVIESRPEVIVEDTRREAPEKLVERVIERLKQSKPAFVLWILEVRKTSPLYAPIKKLCDTVIGVPTQCIVQPPGKGFNDQYLTNVALKMNMKAFELTGKKVGVPNFRPAITYIVAQKRNNVRFLPSQGDRNVQPGTIVDKDVTHPFFFDFYMVSHKGLLGTSRPVHYHVLHDENGFTADEIQHLTHSLCYSILFSSCMICLSLMAVMGDALEPSPLVRPLSPYTTLTTYM
ncbi:unnamed protein product [Closterium sp. NIES-54]